MFRRQPAAETSTDIVEQLFGRRQLRELSSAIEPEIDDALWALKGPLGATEYQKLKNHANPHKQIFDVVGEPRRDNAVANAFKEYVLKSEAMYPLLTAEFKAKADGSRDPPPYRPPSGTASLPGIEEFTSVASFERARTLSRMKGGKVLVVLFMTADSVACRSFAPEYAKIAAAEDGPVTFSTIYVNKPGMSNANVYEITTFPTMIIICREGYYKVTGSDSSAKAQLDKYIKSAILEAISTDSGLSVPSSGGGGGGTVSASGALVRPSVSWPKPPKAWGPAVAVLFWIALPKNVADIRDAALKDPDIRNKLFHTLPYLQSRDPDSCKALQPTVDNFCAHNFYAGDDIISCYDCGINGQFADYCITCFSKANHKDHTVVKRQANSDGLVCDCGRLSRVSGKPLGVVCSEHADISGDLNALVNILALGMMLRRD